MDSRSPLLPATTTSPSEAYRMLHRMQYGSLVAVGEGLVADHVAAGVQRLPDEGGGVLGAEVHLVAVPQNTGRAALGQQPAQSGGRVGDVLPRLSALVWGMGPGRLQAAAGKRVASCQNSAR